jgi:heat shock protein HtpX
MALSHNIKPDRGLTTRMLMTGFFLVLLYALLIGVLFIFLKSLTLILIIAFGLLFCQYFFSDKIAMFAMHAKEVTPQEAPELHGVIDRLCALADMPKPRVAIARTDVPNAFATGRSPKAAVVCATTGLMRRLDEPEVEAVLAHEISHVAHRDVAVMTIASGLGMIAGLLTRVMFYSEIFGGGRGRNNNSGGQLVLIEMVVMLVSIVVYFVSFLLTMALSRYRELAADRSGAILIGQPAPAGLGPDQNFGRDGPRPHQGPPGRRAVQRLLLRAGAEQRAGPAAGPERGLQLRRPVPDAPHPGAPPGPARPARAPARASALSTRS